MEGEDVQQTHAHRDTNTDLLPRPHLQPPNERPWQQREVKVRDRAPRGVEDAVVDRDDGVPAVTFEGRVPRFSGGRALDPGYEGGRQHEEEQSDDAEPDGPADFACGEAEQGDAEGDLREGGGEAGD